MDDIRKIFYFISFSINVIFRDYIVNFFIFLIRLFIDCKVCSFFCWRIFVNVCLIGFIFFVIFNRNCLFGLGVMF